MPRDDRFNRGVTREPTAPQQSSPRTAALAFAADVAWIVILVVIGLCNHAEGITLAGVGKTAWPFLAGLTASWLLYRAWRASTIVWPTGITIWLNTAAIGIGLRAGTGAGITLSFVAVAIVFTGVSLLGWRAAVTALGRRW